MMQFTPQEQKMIDGLRKQERLWPKTRWVLLVMGGLVFSVYAYIAGLMISGLYSDDLDIANKAMLVALFWPKVLFGSIFGSLFVVLAIKDWKGNANRMLLLRLLDAHQSESNKISN